MKHSGKYEGDLLEEMDAIMFHAQNMPRNKRADYLRGASHRIDEFVSECSKNGEALIGCDPVSTLFARTELEMIARDLLPEGEKE